MNSRTEIMDTLISIQNHAACVNQDIMSISAFMSDAELDKHIQANSMRIVHYQWAQADGITLDELYAGMAMGE